MNNNLWFKLLYYWCYDNNKSGLTLPFLIGSEKHINKKHISVKELLIEFSENKNNHYISIENCDVINEYVIKLYKNEDLISLNHYPNYQNLYIQDDILERFGNLDEISSYFDKKYSDYIKQEKYSKVSGKWMKFTSDDIEMINNFK